DSNVFLQCKALHDLSWSDVSQANDIELLIGAPVQDEIDRLKYDGNQRRARRAREANSLFRKVMDADGESLTLRPTGPRIVLRHAPILPPKRESAEGLDLTRADDQLIDEVMHFRRTEAAAEILTDDTGMLQRCRRHRVPAVAVPESWLRPQEKDERDKQIAALNAEIAALRSSESSLSLSIESDDGRAIKTIDGHMPLYADLSKAELGTLVKQAQSRHPETKDFGSEQPSQARPGDITGLRSLLHPIYGWRAPTSEEIAAYQKEYETWIGKLPASFRQFGQFLRLTHRVRKLHISLANTGSRPADEVLVELTAHGNVTFLTTVGDEVPDLIEEVSKFELKSPLPSPPKPPKGEYLHEAFAHSTQFDIFGGDGLNRSLKAGLSSYLPKYVQRDRHEFYRREDDANPSCSASFGCEEFRHQRAPERISLWLIAPPQVEPVLARLHVRVSARNMTHPVDLYIPIEIESKLQSTFDIAANWRVSE
ncbi:MAG TPA: PIN domain-containing protein, partial [Steroidobacteraceae bacterium]